MVLLLVAFILIGCGHTEDSTADGNDEPEIPRIVSLSPAISRTLIDFELDAHLVGRTPFCDTVDSSIPIVGDLLDLNMEMLVRVRPTHVLVQPPASGLDPALVRQANKREWTLGAWHLDSIDDVRAMIGEMPTVLGAAEVDAPGGLAERAMVLLEKIDNALRAEENIFGGSVLLVIGLEPVTVFGRETYLDEVLAALGGRNVITHPGYPQFSLEDITRIKPEGVILIAPRTNNDMSPRERLGAVGRLDIPAVRDGRLAVLDHPDGFLPSSGLLGVAEQMREILHRWHANETSKRPNVPTSKYSITRGQAVRVLPLARCGAERPSSAQVPRWRDILTFGRFPSKGAP